MGFWINGKSDEISTTLGGHSDKAKGLIARFKSTGKTLFRGHKSLEIMDSALFCHKAKMCGAARGRMAVHELVFDVITVVIQYRFENRKHLFEV